jgi:hypothetical protein
MSSIGLPVAPAPAASVVGTSFVNQYYSCLQNSPHNLYRFYMDHSHLTLAQSHESTGVTVVSHANISDRFGSLDLEGCKAVIISVDSQYTSGSGVLVQVTGTIAHRSAPAHPRPFVQSFVLAPQAKGYYVLNDIVRYTASAHEKQPVTASSLPSGAAATSPAPAAAAPPPPAPPAPPPLPAAQVVENVEVPLPDVPLASTSAEPAPEDDDEEDEGKPRTYADIIRKNKLAAQAAAAVPAAPPPPPPQQQPGLPLPLPLPAAGAPAGGDDDDDAPKFDMSSIFVRNVPGSMDEAAVSGLFAQFGRVKHVSLKPQKNSRENDRIAFIDFDSAAAASSAIAASLLPEGRKLAVERKKVLPLGPRPPLLGALRLGASGGGGLAERGPRLPPRSDARPR